MAKPVVLFLHGFLESSHIWQEIIPHVEQHVEVHTMDLPGHGDAPVLAEVHTMVLMADVVFYYCTKHKLQHITLIGHSMGGYVGLAFVEKYPQLLDHLILLNSTTKADSLTRKQNRDRGIRQVAKHKDVFISMAISNLFLPENHKKFKETITQLKQRAKKFPSEGIIAALQGMKVRPDRTDILTNFTGKKTFIAGKDDPLIPVQESRQIAKETGTKYYELPGGHMSYLEDTAQLRGILVELFKE
ncbi:alpha/beta hydrolase [Gangjinia marincola]|uniref:Alpha/beta hydrolase n=1 Tax=Gangjinia marincola TaxID=578463 RepID=A0ABN1MEN2_9FLAO